MQAASVDLLQDALCYKGTCYTQNAVTGDYRIPYTTVLYCTVQYSTVTGMLNFLMIRRDRKDKFSLTPQSWNILRKRGSTKK